MKNFTFNLLQQLNKKKADKGFTLIELLVVIIIIGILSAIALPAFLNQAAKAKQSEAKQALGALNRGQQAYRLENVEFAPNTDLLALGLETNTKNYAYGKSSTGDATTPDNIADSATADVNQFDTNADFATDVFIFADAKDDASVRTYAAGVGAAVDEEGNAATVTNLCEGLKPGDQPVVDYTASQKVSDQPVECSGDSKSMSQS
jgi:type IV pilus assembly protein PilA